MAQQKRAVESPPSKRNQGKATPTVGEELTVDLAALTQLTGSPVANAGDSTIEAQAARLSDSRLLTAQRRALAAQLGRVQGNQYLQRVVASLKREKVRAGPKQYQVVRRQPAAGPGRSGTARKDVAIIVGRPSQTIPRRETRKDKVNMLGWRAAATALAPIVMEGLTVDRAFRGLRRVRFPIGRLYIIAHGGGGGIGEVSSSGNAVLTTVASLTRRIRTATGSLGSRAPRTVEMLSCYGGSVPKTMAAIGGAVGASTVRAPMRMTVIGGIIIKLKTRGRLRRLDRRNIARLRLTDDNLKEYIKHTDALKHYDFVPGVPHPRSGPSTADKLKALARVLRKTGMIPFVSYNAAPGERYAVAYWKAPVQRRSATAKAASALTFLGTKGVIEVTVPKPARRP